MNERIKLLAEQAHELATVKKVPLVQWLGQEEYHKIFAELIVRECVDICEKGTETQTTSSGAAILIKQRFGVKI